MSSFISLATSGCAVLSLWAGWKIQKHKLSVSEFRCVWEPLLDKLLFPNQPIEGVICYHVAFLVCSTSQTKHNLFETFVSVNLKCVIPCH